MGPGSLEGQPVLLSHEAGPVTGTPHYPCAGHRSALIRFISEFGMWLVATRWADMSVRWYRIAMAARKKNGRIMG
ncbi:hypothetical protein D1814_07395 [Alteromonas sp. BL110]|nr:hypothetical protein D1814_07395 [Alteromonas sp. BL110]RKM83750.1 hypothetical protein D7031_01540 [Alteromonas sp. BL110]